MIWTCLIIIETKLHTLPTMWKVLMLQTLHVIIKRQVSHLIQDQKNVYHQQWGENISRVYYNKAKNMKMYSSKQHSTQRIPL
jgi:hypothetical protein